MLIYHDLHKSAEVIGSRDSLCQGLKQSTSKVTRKTVKKSQLTRINTNFLRDLGFKVRQYK